MLEAQGTLTSGPKTAVGSGRRAAAIAACLLAALVLLAGGGERAGAAKGGGKPPNIVVIVTDDQARSTMSPEVMPNLYSRLIADGTSFSDFVVTTPLCCPSRAAYMTGQYGHNNGVLRNFYPDLRQKRQVLASWLGRRGPDAVPAIPAWCRRLRTRSMVRKRGANLGTTWEQKRPNTRQDGGSGPTRRHDESTT